MNKKIFVFTQTTYNGGRNYLLAIPENHIHTIQSQSGSENCYLKVNGVEVQGSFEKLIEMLGEKVDFK